MRHGVGPYLSIKEIENPSSMMIFIIINNLFNHTFWICLRMEISVSIDISVLGFYRYIGDVSVDIFT